MEISVLIRLGFLAEAAVLAGIFPSENFKQFQYIEFYNYYEFQ